MTLDHASRCSFNILKPTFSATSSLVKLLARKDRSPGSKHCRTQRTSTSSETDRPYWLNKLPSAMMVAIWVKSRQESRVPGLIWDLLKFQYGFKARKSFYSPETCSKGVFEGRVVVMGKDMARREESLA
jgi:hypothetical protein